MAETTTATTTTDATQESQNVSQDTNTTTVATNTTNATNDSQANPDNSQELSIEELIQRAVDRATNKLGNDNKKLRESLTKLQKEKLTSDELKAVQLQEKEDELAQREAEINAKINREFALKAIKDAGLDDGGSNSLELIDFVVCDNEDATRARVKAFGDLVDKFVQAEVDKTFKQNGRNPNASTNVSGDVNRDVIESLGIFAADRRATTDEVLNHYLGGK